MWCHRPPRRVRSSGWSNSRRFSRAHSLTNEPISDIVVIALVMMLLLERSRG
jgi:hypothetical protein